MYTWLIFRLRLVRNTPTNPGGVSYLGEGALYTNFMPSLLFSCNFQPGLLSVLFLNKCPELLYIGT